MCASMVVPNVAYGARATLGLIRKRWRSRRSRSPAATLGMRPCCLSCSTKFLPARRSPPPLPTEPTSSASVTMPLPNEMLPPSFRPAGMRSPGTASLQVQSRVTRHCGHRNTLAARPRDDGADTTTGVASTQRCIVSNCWVSASWSSTSTARSRSSRFVWLC
jgi:hypothetical protein